MNQSSNRKPPDPPERRPRFGWNFVLAVLGFFVFLGGLYLLATQLYPTPSLIGVVAGGGLCGVCGIRANRNRHRT